MTEIYIQTVIAVIAVISIFFLFIVLFKRRQEKANLINVIAYQPFGQRKGVAALKIGKKVFVIGITANDLKLLETMEEIDIENEVVRNIHEKVKELKNWRAGIDEYK